MGRGFSPLDEELGLLPNTRWSPRLLEGLARLGTWLPFEQGPRALAFFWQVEPDRDTARRVTEAVGAAQVAVETTEVQRLERELPPAPLGPPLQVLSVDGALVPLVGGQWAEVKTLALGTVQPPRQDPTTGEWEVHTEDLSYFSRLADAETFTRLATVETHRRGVESAGVVCGVVDGADWCQGFLDLHRPDAVRVLDFAHAVEHLSTAAQATFGAGSAASAVWLQQQRHELKHADPAQVLAALRTLPVEAAAEPAAAAAARAETLGYLEKRREQLRYAEFQAQGYPIGSGSVESANKLVVEARLKGSGMHWARATVNPLLALRGVVCSDRWGAAWPQIWGQLRQQAATRRRLHRARHAPTPAPAPPLPAPALVAAPPCAPALPRPRLVVQGRPTAEHPWRKPFLRRREPPQPAKT